MFATFASATFFGACPRRCTGAGRDCECTNFSLGGATEIFSPLVESPANDTPDRTSLASRLGQFCVCSQSSAARKLKNLRTGVSSGLTVLQPLATLVSDGRITVALTGDVRIDTDRDDVSDARERTAFELLDFYAKFADVDEEELEEALCAGLSVVGGGHPGAFILHDRTKHRVIAARMADGVDLFWGLTPDGALMFSTTMDSAIDQCAYQIFPTDAIFISSVTDPYSVFVENRCPGRLVPFARSVSTLPLSRAKAGAANSAGAGFCRISSGTDLALITSTRGWMLRTPSVTELLNAQTCSAR